MDKFCLKANWSDVSACMFTRQQPSCLYLDVHSYVITLLFGFIEVSQMFLQRDQLFLHGGLECQTNIRRHAVTFGSRWDNDQLEKLKISGFPGSYRGKRTCVKGEKVENRLPWGPGLPPPRGTLCVPGAFWRCGTRSKEPRNHPGRRVWGLPRVRRTSPPPGPAASRSHALRPRPSCSPGPSGRCRPRSSAPGSPWVPSGSTSSCTRDTRAAPSCSRTAAGRPGRSCGCTSAPRAPWRSRSRWGRTAPLPACCLSARRQPEAAWLTPPWGLGRTRAFQAERRHGGAAPWWILDGRAGSFCSPGRRWDTDTLLCGHSRSPQSHLGSLWATWVIDQQGAEEQVSFTSSK